MSSDWVACAGLGCINVCESASECDDYVLANGDVRSGVFCRICTDEVEGGIPILCNLTVIVAMEMKRPRPVDVSSACYTGAFFPLAVAAIVVEYYAPKVDYYHANEINRSMWMELQARVPRASACVAAIDYREQDRDRAIRLISPRHAWTPSGVFMARFREQVVAYEHGEHVQGYFEVPETQLARRRRINAEIRALRKELREAEAEDEDEGVADADAFERWVVAPTRVVERQPDLAPKRKRKRADAPGAKRAAATG